jgi:hypothetical protein
MDFGDEDDNWDSDFDGVSTVKPSTQGTSDGAASDEEAEDWDKDFFDSEDGRDPSSIVGSSSSLSSVFNVQREDEKKKDIGDLCGCSLAALVADGGRARQPDGALGSEPVRFVGLPSAALGFDAIGGPELENWLRTIVTNKVSRWFRSNVRLCCDLSSWRDCLCACVLSRSRSLFIFCRASS